MPKLAVKNRLRAVALIVLFISISSFYAFHSFSMWQKAFTSANNNSISLSPFIKASAWLSANLKQNEIAIVPMLDVFSAVNPELRDKLIDYKSLWDSAKVVLKADTTNEDVLKVRNYFITFLKENSQVRYVVRDWVDPFAKYLYEATTNDELMFLLREVETMSFKQSDGWGNQITIYERMQLATLFAMKFSSPPKQFFSIPSNTSIQFTADGVTIQKVGERAGFYLPLEIRIDASKQNYLTMQFKLDLENVDLILGFYYDVDRNGEWSGYGIDNFAGMRFKQTWQGWVKGEWHQIIQATPNAADPVVQIAVIVEAGTDGTITLANLTVFSER